MLVPCSRSFERARIAVVAGRAIHRLDQFWATGIIIPHLLAYGLKPGKMGRRGSYRPSDENSLNPLLHFSENEALKEVT